MSLPGSLSINQSLVQAAFILPSLLPIMWFALRGRKAGKYRPRKTKREKLPAWLTCSFAHSLLRRSTHKKCQTSNDGSIFSRKREKIGMGLELHGIWKGGGERKPRNLWFLLPHDRFMLLRPFLRKFLDIQQRTIYENIPPLRRTDRSILIARRARPLFYPQIENDGFWP